MEKKEVQKVEVKVLPKEEEKVLPTKEPIVLELETDDKDVAHLKKVTRTTGKDLVPVGLPSMLQLADELVKTDLVKFNSAADCFILLQAAKEYNVGFIFASANMHVIKKKLTLGVHFIEAMLLDNGILFEVIEDYVQVSHWMIRGGMTVALSAKELHAGRDDYQIVTAADFEAGKFEKDKTLLIAGHPPHINDQTLDRRTKIKFTRMIKLANGEWQLLEHTIDYYLHEAYLAGFLGGNVEKDNWAGHTASMCYTRCLTRGGRRIGADVLKGLMETNEAAEIHGATVLLGKDGKEIMTIIEDDPNNHS
ncbi:MAG: hypothetical protein COA82_03430 [Alkaliphilus sp.]|nr:MAG: hypothetical protein COA82_03430 [Alkaliphilus sp.]